MSITSLNPWDVRETDFPATGRPAEQLRFLLRYAVLAPSGHNTQPWLFKIDDDAVELYADRTRALPVVDPDDRELTISCGAALFHLRIALRHFGYAGAVATFPDPDDPDLLARIHMGKSRSASAQEQALFDAIGKRHTNRQAFEQRAVPEDVLITLQQAAHAEGAWLYLVQGEENRTALVGLIALGDRMQWADKHFRRELAAWARPSRNQRRDSRKRTQLRESALSNWPQDGANLRSGQWTGCKRSPACNGITCSDSAWNGCRYSLRLAHGGAGISTSALVCTCPRDMGFILESTHRSPRATAYAAQDHRASRLPTTAFAYGLRTRGSAHPPSQRERSALVTHSTGSFSSEKDNSLRLREKDIMARPQSDYSLCLSLTIRTQ